MLRKTLVSALVAACSLVGAVSAAAVAQADPGDTNTYRILSAATYSDRNQYVADVRRIDFWPGTPVIAYKDKATNNSNQRWYLPSKQSTLPYKTEIKTYGRYEGVNLCLDDVQDGDARVARVVNCTEQPQQQWEVRSRGGQGVVEIRALDAGGQGRGCLTVVSPGNENIALNVSSCLNSNELQAWFVQQKPVS